MMTTLAKTPYNYEEYIVSDGMTFVDGHSQLSATMFKDSGARCPCHSTRIHYNKYSFASQHCKSKKHIEWLAKMTSNHEGIVRTGKDRAAEIKDLRVRLEKEERKNKRLERQLGEFDKTNREKDASHALELEEIKADSVAVTEAYEILSQKLNDKTEKLDAFRVWVKVGVSEIMGREWEESDEESDDGL